MKNIYKLSLLGILSTPVFSSQFITIGTGGVTGTYYPTGGAICRFVNQYKKESKIRCSVESTDGSLYNLNTLKNGELDFGIVQSDIVYQASKGEGQFKDTKLPKLRSVMAIYPELLTLVTKKDANINKLLDIKDKRINLGNSGSGNETTALALFEASGIDKNDLILDFFSGSATTAHAVMKLNSEDDGNRKFICVQLPETTDEKSEAYKAGYKKISDITKARIDKAGEQIAKGDIGFRTFEIVEDQKQKIYQKSLEVVNQDDLLSLMEKPDISSNEEILYNLFVAEALPLSTKHQELIKDKLYLASNVAFILGDITSDELVEALKDKKECEYITVYSPNISNDKFTLEIESNISKLGIKSDKLRFRG